MKADMAQILVLFEEKKSAPNHTIPEGSNISRFFTVLICLCVEYVTGYVEQWW